MAQTPPNKKTELKKLQDIWYKKLKKSGFEDIEQDEDHLKEWSNRFVCRLPPAEVWQARQEYYLMAERFLNDFKFKDSLDKTIWTQHAEGNTVRAISTFLAKRRNAKLSYNAVWHRIKHYEKEMFRMYLDKTGDDNV